MIIRSVLTVATAAIGFALLPSNGADALSLELANPTTLIATSEANDHSQGPSSVSSDGRFALFYSAANNLVPGDTNGLADLFLHDAVTGTRERINVGTGGVQANAWTGRVA